MFTAWTETNKKKGSWKEPKIDNYVFLSQDDILARATNVPTFFKEAKYYFF